MHPYPVKEEGRARSKAKLHRSIDILGRYEISKLYVTGKYFDR